MSDQNSQVETSGQDQEGKKWTARDEALWSGDIETLKKINREHTERRLEQGRKATPLEAAYELWDLELAKRLLEQKRDQIGRDPSERRIKASR